MTYYFWFLNLLTSGEWLPLYNVLEFTHAFNNNGTLCSSEWLQLCWRLQSLSRKQQSQQLWQWDVTTRHKHFLISITSQARHMLIIILSGYGLYLANWENSSDASDKGRCLWLWQKASFQEHLYRVLTYETFSNLLSLLLMQEGIRQQVMCDAQDIWGFSLNVHQDWSLLKTVLPLVYLLCKIQLDPYLQFWRDLDFLT